MKKTVFILILSFVFHSLSAGNNGMTESVNDTSATTVGQNIKTSGSSSASVSSSGINTNTSLRERKGSWTFGGGIGVGFGDYTSVSVSPQVGYNFNRYFTLGGGLSYNYFSWKDYDSNLNYLGLNLYGRLFPIRYITMFVQPEVQKRWGKVWGEKTNNDIFACLLVGGGLVYPVSDRAGIMLQVYYDVLQDSYTPHGDKIGYSIGFTFGF